jgi:hypothetical protein
VVESGWTGRDAVLLLLLRLLPNIAFPDKVVVVVVMVVVVHAVHGSEPNDMMQSGAAVEDMKLMLDDDGIILCFY